MKKILSLIMLCLFLTIFSHITLAKSRAVYYTSDPIYVTTRMGTITILFFNVEIESTICGNSNFFKIDKDGKLDKLVITPQKPGTWTNLVVVTKDNLKYTFRLTETDKGEYDDTIDVRPIVDIDPKEFITMANRPANEIDPAIRKLIGIFTVEPKQYSFNNVTIEIKKIMIIENLEKTLLWLRVTNIVDASSTTLDTSLYIPVGLVKLKERELFFVAMETNKERLKPNDFVDIYIMENGLYPDTAITLFLTINGKEQNFLLSDIPYQKQDFKVYSSENKLYENISLDNYVK